MNATDAAKAMPAPKPGMTLERVPLDVLFEYLNLHGYEIERVSGGTVTVRAKQGDTMVDVAKQLSEIGD